MRIRTLVSVCFVAGMFATSVGAQVVVVGNGDAAACWRAAEFGEGTMNEGFQLCSQALSMPQMSLRDRAGTHVNRAVIRMRAGDNGGALNDANMAIDLLAGMGEAHVNRGAALLNLMRPQEALDAIEFGLNAGSAKLYLVYYNRGTAKFLLGDVRGAYFDYRESATLRPDFPLAMEALSHFQVTTRPGTAQLEDGATVEDVVATSNPVLTAQ